jgi:Flp pilus assembly protein protease CpaA
MQGVQFEEDNLNYKSRSILGLPQQPGMVRFLIKKGIAKTEKQAFYFLVATAIISAISCIVIFYLNNSDNSNKTRSPEVEKVVKQMENKYPQQ